MNADPALPDRPNVPHRRRWLIGAVIVVAVATATLGVADPFAGSSHLTSGTVDNADPTALQAVARENLTSQTQVAATLGYAGSFSVFDQAQGTFTAVPAVGQVISQGQVFYEVDGLPVVLLYGATPAYRNLSEGERGPDVEELNDDLVALGEYPHGDATPTSDVFDAATEYGVKKLQAALGVTQTGTLALGQADFLSTAALVTSVAAALGAPAQMGQPVMSATSTTRQVSIALDADQQSEVAVGDHVTITLPNNQTTPGVISSVGTVAATANSDSSSDSPTVTVLVNLTDPAMTGSGDQVPVEVSITTGAVSNALAVPVDGLLALSGGGYAVEVAETRSVHELVPVSLGLFDDADGLVQVSGKGISAGQNLVVPAL
jgi:peptidoglycan hydrolase-like protein with peptidoglycan-binding domain